MDSAAISRRAMLQGAAVLLAGCGARGTRGTASAPGTPWEAIVAAARREGRVVMYGGLLESAHVGRVASAFKAATGLDFDFLRITGAPAMTRIHEEAKVGLAPDVFDATGGWLHDLAEAKLLLPLRRYDLPVWSQPDAVWDVRPWYKMASGEFILSRLRVRQGHLGVNMRRMEGIPLPRSWAELGRDPRYRAQLVLLDPARSSNSAADFVMQGYVGKAMTARDMWNIFVGQQPMLVSVPRANVTSVAMGERAMTFPPLDETVINLLEAGAPARNFYLPNTPIFAETAEMGVIREGAHPNAALVFIDWLLSQPAQALLAELLHQTSMRRDVPNTVPAHLRGEVVGGGPRGPILVDSPAQTRLIQDLLAAGLMKLLTPGASPERFEREWQGFITEWERTNGGPQDKVMAVEVA